MKKRPLSVTLLSCTLVATGMGGLAFHTTEFNPQHPLEPDVILASLVRLLAVLGGVYMFLGRNWARWLALLWIAFHVILSAFQSLQQLIAHVLVLAVFAYVLLRPPATDYFRRLPAV